MTPFDKLCCSAFSTYPVYSSTHGLGRSPKELTRWRRARRGGQQFLRTLPTERNWEGCGIFLYQRFWFNEVVLRPIISFQQHLQARYTGSVLVSFPKLETTWLKTLSFSILKSSIFPQKNSLLLTKNRMSWYLCLSVISTRIHSLPH